MVDTISLPVRAADVTLLGPLADAAFEERQWLVRRGQQFVQVTELLYRILEHADGHSSMHDIAARVTQTSDWQVSAEDVAALIQTRLRPLRLAAHDGEVLQDGVRDAAAGALADRGGSLLAMRMRMKVIGPRVIEPITRVLQCLFAPVMLVPLLLLAAIAHAWAYATIDIGDAVAATLYTPGGLLLALGVLVAAALFHELGHASALRYGGGQVRGIGVGLYLIFPAFYTDVTDAYRLGRAARVRTDLGGVYFHLLAAAALMGLAAASASPLPLFAAVLINIEIARQFIPFVKLDGYWLLADITGVPDLLSQAGPFLRSIIRRRRRSGPVLPNLRPWAKATFLVYLIATVPVLVYLFALMLVSAPALFVAAREAFVSHSARIFSNEPWWTTMLAFSQMCLIALPAIGTVLIIGSVLSLPLSPLIATLSPHSRRVVGRLALTTASAVVIAWLAQGGSTSATGAVSESDRIVAQARAAIAGVDTLRAEVEGSVGPDRFTGAIWLKRPNLARIEIRGSEGLGRFDVVSNGSELLVYFPNANQFSRMPPGPQGQHISAFVVGQVHHFFNPTTLPRLAPGAVATVEAGTPERDPGYRVLRIDQPQTGRTTRYFVSTSDGLVHRIAYHDTGSDTAGDFVELKNVRAGESLPDATFAWRLPPDATTLQMPVSVDFGGR